MKLSGVIKRGRRETATYRELQLNLFPCQVLSGTGTCFSLHIRPVLNGIDGSGSGRAQQRGGGGGGEQVGMAWSNVDSEELWQEKSLENVLSHFCCGHSHQFWSKVLQVSLAALLGQNVPAH